MAVIKFSHNYPKLHGQRSAMLLACTPITIDSSEKSKKLLEYDTKYDGGYFTIAPGNYVLLTFLGDCGIPFTSIRNNYPPTKEDYYQGKVGDTFDIVIRKRRKA